MARPWKLYAGLIVLLLAGFVAGQQAPNFDYYVLSLSWAPEFCAQPGQAAANPRECRSTKPMQFVVHGLWPEVLQGKNPESCGPAKNVPKGLVNEILPYIPSPGLIQHEWATHGTCSGLPVEQYFTLAIRARALVQAPVEISSITETTTEGVGQIEAQFAGANPSFPPEAFRVACRNGALTEVRVCFDKELKGRACAARVGSCDLPSVTIRPRG